MEGQSRSKCAGVPSVLTVEPMSCAPSHPPHPKRRTAGQWDGPWTKPQDSRVQVCLQVSLTLLGLDASCMK